MSKILYYCDLHHGPDKDAYDATDVPLLGAWAFDINIALLNYAATQGFDHVIHGGDESTFIIDPDEPTHHLRRAKIIQQTMNYPNGSLHRLIGNHEPISQLTDLGFRTESYKNVKSRKTRLILCQPQIRKTPEGKTLYAYDPKHILNLTRQWQPAASKNIIVSGHWAFDRMERGYPELYNIKGYAYHDRTAKLKTRFAEFAGENINRFLSLHAHEHRFSWTTTLGFNCLVMPSIVQKDVDAPDKPCGLFVEIDDDTNDGSLRMTFKKITIHDRNCTDDFSVETVPLEHMQRYHRPVARHLFQ